MGARTKPSLSEERGDGRREGGIDGSLSGAPFIYHHQPALCFYPADLANKAEKIMRPCCIYIYSEFG